MLRRKTASNNCDCCNIFSSYFCSDAEVCGLLKFRDVKEHVEVT